MIVFVWLIFAFASMMIASAKGNSGFGGFMLGLLLGPIGLVIVAVVPSKQPQLVKMQGRPETEEGEEKVCGFCRSWIPASATVCRYCQRESHDALNSTSGGF